MDNEPIPHYVLPKEVTMKLPLMVQYSPVKLHRQRNTDIT